MADTSKPLGDVLRAGVLVSCFPAEDRIRDAGGDLSQGPDLLTLSRPAVIRQFHGGFADAVAALLVTKAGLCENGRTAEVAAQRLTVAGADVVGVNGGRSIAATLRTAERFVAGSGKSIQCWRFGNDNDLHGCVEETRDAFR